MGLWLAFLGLIASPDNPNGGCNLPPVAHFSPHTHPTPSYISITLYVHIMIIITVVVKKVLKIQQCQLASRNSYKTLAKGLFQLYSISSVTTIYHKKTIVVSVFEIGIPWNTKCDNLVSFPKLGYIWLVTELVIMWHN